MLKTQRWFGNGEEQLQTCFLERRRVFFFGAFEVFTNGILNSFYNHVVFGWLGLVVMSK